MAKSQYNVVVIDDDQGILDLFTMKIKKLYGDKINLICLDNIQEGCDFIFGNNVDFIVTDIHLGTESGEDILQYCFYLNKGIQVIALSADEKAGTIDMCFKGGALHYLQKPIKDDDLQNAFNKAIGQIDYWSDLIEGSEKEMAS